MRRVTAALVVHAAFVLNSLLWAQLEEPPPIVREVEIRFVGPETVSRAIVNANIATAVGKPFSTAQIEQDVKNLISTGYFLDVRVLQETLADGVKVVFQVQGKATIKEITIEGCKRYKPERLRREIPLKEGDVVNELKAHQGALKIEEMYQKAGYPDIKVTDEVNIDKDTSKAILKFKIDEGSRLFVKRIEFTGNKAYPTGRLLKLMKTRKRWWGSFFAGTGILKDEQFKEDLEKLRDHYRSNGYLDMEIRNKRIERVGKQWIVVHLDIFEGTQYKVGDVRIEGNKLFPTAELQKHLRMVTGQIFTPKGLQDDIKALEDYYGARGYLDSSARPTRTANIDTGRMDLTYTIREGELNYIEKIVIRGNTKTKDKVIRRELAVAPGDVYNTVRVDRSAERLKNLGYFSKVETTPEPTEVPNRKDLVINLEEQRTGSVTFGAGFSSIDSLIGFVEVTQGNFDLFNWPNFTGGGQKLRIRAQVGLKRQDYILSFTEPWFLDQRLSLGVDVFHRTSGFLSSQFNEERTGGALRLEKALSEFIRGQVQYSIQAITENVDRTASAELRSQNGSNLRSAMEWSLVYDARDSVFLTTRGNRTELSAEVAGGPLGGTISLYKLNAKTTFYFPFFNKHVLEILGAAGVVDVFGASRGDGPFVNDATPPFLNVHKVDDVPIYDRYFLGGANTLRGFSYRQVGPKDPTGEPLGGNTYANGTAEYSFPIVERVRGAVFYDVGNVWLNSYEFNIGDLKSDVGVGIRLNLPIGPVRLDYGYPVQTDKQTGKAGKIQFSVGYQF